MLPEMKTQARSENFVVVIFFKSCLAFGFVSWSTDLRASSMSLFEDNGQHIPNTGSREGAAFLLQGERGLESLP